MAKAGANSGLNAASFARARLADYWPRKGGVALCRYGPGPALGPAAGNASASCCIRCSTSIAAMAWRGRAWPIAPGSEFGKPTPHRLPGLRGRTGSPVPPADLGSFAAPASPRLSFAHNFPGVNFRAGRSFCHRRSIITISMEKLTSGEVSADLDAAQKHLQLIPSSGYGQPAWLQVTLASEESAEHGDAAQKTALGA